MDDAIHSTYLVDAVNALTEMGYEICGVWGASIHAIDAKIENLVLTNPSAKILAIAVIDDVTPSRFQNHPNVTLLRTSLLKSSKGSREFVMPYIYEPRAAQIPVLEKGPLPRVAFCGVSNHPLRQRAVIALENAPDKIETHYLLRRSFWGGKAHDPTIVREFNENMASSEFNLCARGGGNFSMRLYQTLSAGRIPIIVQSETDLPWEDRIDWNQIAVVVHEGEDIVQKVVDFWNTHNIAETQQLCYDTYVAQLTGTGLLNNIRSLLT